MKKIKILNLYACLGGNRYKWDEVAKSNNYEFEITAIEHDKELCNLYQDRFPNDIVINTDAHQYLLENYKFYDIIWSSPPCPSHSSVRISQKNTNKFIPIYPSMSLYEEIIFLQYHFKGKYIVENVIPYYKPLIDAQKRGRHLYWTNFKLPQSINERKSVGISTAKKEVEQLSKFHEFDFSLYKGNQSVTKIARNLVDYEAGKTILEVALNAYKINDMYQKQIEY